MAALWIMVQLWILSCGIYLAARPLGLDPMRVALRLPAIACGFLLLRVFV